jgi:integrase
MIRSKRLDDAGVANLKPGRKRVTLADPELRGHYIRTTPNGGKSFWVVARDPHGKQHWKLIGSPPMKIADARLKAMATLQAIRCAESQRCDTAEADSFETIAGNWLERHVVKKGLRSEGIIRALLKNHITPAFAGMNFADVRRKDITALLDRVEDASGQRTADYVLSILTTLCNWHAKRDEDYRSPIIRGMGRREKHDRDRILSDRELRTLWKAGGMFGAFCKLALLTAQRKEKISSMRFVDVQDGVWHIPQEDRQKGTGEALPLPQIALGVIEDQRRANPGSPFVFAASRSTLTRAKKAFETAHPWPQWQLHDLRRSSRSLMAAAGVPDLVAELVLGHKQRGVAAIYNRHGYLDEKGDALARLAQRVVEIVTPPPINVTKLRRVS